MSMSDATTRVTRQLAERGVLLADGAIGTNLFAAGLQTGDAPELWNEERPEPVIALHRAFVDAGSDIVLTNSFGGNRFRLALHGAVERVETLNRAAARLARTAADSADRPVMVAGSMGPTGEILQPHGGLSEDDCADAFEEQARALADGGADILWIETLSSSEEIRAALVGAARVGLPIALTASLDTNGRTMMGLTGPDVLALCARAPGDVPLVGTNCGVGAAEVVAAIAAMRPVVADDLAHPALVAKANCGIPQYVDGRIVYDGTPEVMARYAALAIDAGARIIGGCCGTTPAHVAAMRTIIDTHTSGEPPSIDTIVEALGEVSHGIRAQLAGDSSVAAGSASGRGKRESRRRRRIDDSSPGG